MATGNTLVREFIEEGFKYFGEKIVWVGEGLNEKGVLKSNRKIVITINPKYFRKTEVDLLLGDASKAEKELNWKAKTSFKDLVRTMVKFDYDKLKKRLDHD